MSDSLIIIPTYNERDNVAQLLRTIFSLSKDFHVLIVDDNSPDGTSGIVKNLQKEYTNQLFLLERKGKLGLGTAYIEGFQFAINKKYAYIFEMDCDFSHNPNDLIRLYNACAVDGFDMSIGSRYIKGGGIKDWPLNRLILSKGASIYVQCITWMGIKDPTAGFICYTSNVLKSIPFGQIRFVGYAFQIEMKFRAKKNGFSIVEVPIIFKDRQHGESKISKGIIKEGIIGTLELQWKYLFGRL